MLRGERREKAEQTGSGKRGQKSSSCGRECRINQKNKSSEWIALSKAPSYVFRYMQDGPFFAVAARRRDLQGDRYDPRDLGIIPESLQAALKKIDEAGFKVAHIGAIASGQHRPWHPIHPFAQMLRGIRRFIADGKVRNLNYLNLHLLDPSVWYPILAGKIPVAELLSSDLVTHRVELFDEDGNTEVFVVTVPDSPTLDNLLKQCKVDTRAWEVGIVPRPMGEHNDQTPERDLVIAPTMIVTLKPKSAPPN
jgi:hypothetical protein